MRILLIEDDVTDIVLVKRWLQDHELVVCENPMAALAILLQDEDFDVCLCDHALPMADEDRFIKSLRDSCNFPIVGYSGDPSEIAPVAKEQHEIIKALEAAVKLNDE